MGNKFQKLLYTLSAAAPVCFVFSIVWLIQKKTWQLPVVCVAIAIAIILLFYKSFELLSNDHQGWNKGWRNSPFGVGR